MTVVKVRFPLTLFFIVRYDETTNTDNETTFFVIFAQGSRQIQKMCMYKPVLFMQIH